MSKTFRYAASSHFSKKKATAEVAGRKAAGCFQAVKKATLISNPQLPLSKIQTRLSTYTVMRTKQAYVKASSMLPGTK